MKSARTLLSRLAPLVVVASLAAMPWPTFAADRALPEGSWRQTCRDGGLLGDVLFAQCQAEDGSYRSTSARITSCKAFGNRNGTLFCETPRVATRWSGSFSESCRDVSVDKNGRLSAACRKDNGKYVRSNLVPQKCPGYRAGNSNGHLVCESQAESNASQWAGAFRTSCRDITTDSYGTLTATCETANGNWRSTRLSLSQCGSRRAGNRDGHLFCESQSGGSVSQWDGSFRTSCRDVTTDSYSTLTATCQTANGEWRSTRLSPNQCGSRRAGNRDGRLVCESQAGGSVSQWEGSFRSSCRDASTDASGTLTATCQTANGNWQRTSLSLNQCGSYRAGNRDGRLVCEA
jgi:hypothetical protein